MKHLWIGIDNGASGTLALLSDFAQPMFMKIPVMKMQDYCKQKKQVSRLDHVQLKKIIVDYCRLCSCNEEIQIMAGIERPMVNPKMWKASESAMRFTEATWIVMEQMSIPVVFLASTDWQRDLLPKGTKGKEDLKKASLDIGNRLYPQFRDFKHPDKDGLLIAHHMKMKYQ